MSAIPKNLPMAIGSRRKTSSPALARRINQRRTTNVAEELSERDETPGSLGHRAPHNGFEEDENVGEELVSGGIEEAAHDQMVEARREELEEEREER